MDSDGFESIPMVHKTPKFFSTNGFQETKALKLNGVVSTKAATWYSTTASRISLPVIDMVNARYCATEYNLSWLEHTWLCSVVSTRMCVRAVGSKRWFIGGGTLCEHLAIGWPANEVQGTNFVVPDFSKGSCYEYLTIVDVDAWEAFPFEVFSPQHSAIAREEPTAHPHKASVDKMGHH
jgi:hypothetical protein